MIELVLSVCLVAEPVRCKDVSLAYAEEMVSPFQCMMAAPSEVAKWADAHPAWSVKRWTCQPAGRMAKV